MKTEVSRISFNDCDGLWLLLQKGDRKGLEGLYRLFSHELFKYGLALVPDEDFIQDCIQEVFIDLWKYHPSLQKADNVKVYLFKSLSHKVYRESKKKAKRKMEALDDLCALPYSIEPMESTLIGIQREQGIQQKLARGIEKLPLRQKQVIQLLFFEQFSYEEVAKMMGINLRSAYTLAWKSIGSLKKHVISLLGIILIFL